MTVSYTTAVRNARADAITAAIGASGVIRIYDGTPPASANAALAGNTLLATLALSVTAAPGASGGVLTYDAITTTTGVAAGTASFYRVLKSDLTTVTEQGTVGVGSGDLQVNTTTVSIGVNVSITAKTFTEGNP